MPSITFENVEPIYRGYDASIKIIFSDAIWAAYFAGVTEVRASLKNKLEDAAAVVTLSLTGGSIVKNDGEKSITLNVPGASSALFLKSSVLFDISTTLGAVKRIAPGRWAWAVREPITDPT